MARAETAVTRAGETLLVERLHRILDEGGTTALAEFSGTLLPHLHELVASLPRLLRDELTPDTIATIQGIGAALQAHGASLEDVLGQGVELHDRVLREVGEQLRESDRALVMAVSQLSLALLRIGQGALLAYYDSATFTLGQLAHSDALTGLANRRSFEARFNEELQRAQRGRRPLALVLLDIDELKPINDTFGHASGDHLLRVVAAVLRAQTRAIDVAARIGGDEFALLLPDTEREGLGILMDRLTRDLCSQHVQGRPPTVSAGVAIYPDDGRLSHELLERADAALYAAKRARRTASVGVNESASGTGASDLSTLPDASR